MRHEIKKIAKILDELVTFCFQHDTKNMTITINNNDDHFKMHFDADQVDCNDKRVKKLKSLLNVPRQTEMEEYYWELAGECDKDTELSLVGMMVDRAEITFKGTSLSIILYRTK